MITKEQAIDIFLASGMKHKHFSKACGLNKGGMWDIMHRHKQPTKRTLSKIEHYAIGAGLFNPNGLTTIKNILSGTQSMPIIHSSFDEHTLNCLSGESLSDFQDDPLTVRGFMVFLAIASIVVALVLFLI